MSVKRKVVKYVPSTVSYTSKLAVFDCGHSRSHRVRNIWDERKIPKIGATVFCKERQQ